MAGKVNRMDEGIKYSGGRSGVGESGQLARRDLSAVAAEHFQSGTYRKVPSKADKYIRRKQKAKKAKQDEEDLRTKLQQLDNFPVFANNGLFPYSETFNPIRDYNAWHQAIGDYQVVTGTPIPLTCYGEIESQFEDIKSLICLPSFEFPEPSAYVITEKEFVETPCMYILPPGHYTADEFSESPQQVRDFNLPNPKQPKEKQHWFISAVPEGWFMRMGKLYKLPSGMIVSTKPPRFMPIMDKYKTGRERLPKYLIAGFLLHAKHDIGNEATARVMHILKNPLLVKLFHFHGILCSISTFHLAKFFVMRWDLWPTAKALHHCTTLNDDIDFIELFMFIFQTSTLHTYRGPALPRSELEHVIKAIHKTDKVQAANVMTRSAHAKKIKKRERATQFRERLASAPVDGYVDNTESDYESDDDEAFDHQPRRRYNSSRN